METRIKDQTAATDSDNRDIMFTKSYRPTETPIFTEEQKKKMADNADNIRTDGSSLRYDAHRNMYFYPPKDKSLLNESSQPELTDPRNNGIKRNCILI